MICPEDKLDSAINTGCSTPFGMEHNGYLTLRSGLVGKSITDLSATFYPLEALIPVYQPVSDLGYKPKADGEKNPYGLLKFAKTIEVFLIANTELTQTQIMQLKDEDWVFVGKQKDGQNVVFGYERGLRLKTTSQDLNSMDTHGGVLLTFDENAVNYPMLFTSDLIYNFINFENVVGLSIPATGKVYLEVDSDKTCYVVLPNGTLLTSTSGVIDYDYTGVAGAVKLVVPKDTTLLRNTNDDDSKVFDFSGVFIYSGLGALKAVQSDITKIYANNIELASCYNNTLLSELHTDNATSINAVNCALTAKSIGDFLIAASVNNPTASGTADFTGGTNADKGAIRVYMEAALGVSISSLADWITANLSSWDGNISYNGE